ncbi:hypothetical protein QFZ53_001243 [Microbacterium natoriense]|uniref:Uncharacterized protein n=1 Tax=Microbacterium natoriense TaxID=284570 RepID=A0AAW8EUT0_9MICO|nr:hypothetical protein [Microbacterium natoriense]
MFIAILLAALGVRDDDIIRTYAESAERLGDGFLAEVVDVLRGDASANTALPDSVIEEMLSSPAAYIEEVLANIRHDHGTVAAYLLANGLANDELRQIREKLLT